MTSEENESLRKRKYDLDIDPEKFRKLGYDLIDKLSDYLKNIENRKITTGESPGEIRSHLSQHSLPMQGEDPEFILRETFELLIKHSLHIGHPKFWGFICGSGMPVNWLADLLVSAVNPNVGGYVLSPIATEIEKQTIGWIADLINCPDHKSGILVSGGNMANMIGFWAARKDKAPHNIQLEGVGKKMISYVSGETHTWIQKAADLSGLGTESVRWLSPGDDGKMPLQLLEQTIKRDLEVGYHPFLVVANAGSVSTGAIDPIIDINKICRKYNLWLHVDGAYGGIASALPNISEDLKAIKLADSIAIDPHKWLYSSLEVGCTLVKEEKYLVDTFRYKPPYYKFEEHQGDTPTNYYEMGPQNSRRFRALKVWMGLRQAGKEGYIENLKFDIALARSFYNLLDNYPQLEANTCQLSICTFRYIPNKFKDNIVDSTQQINSFNEALLLKIQKEGKAFISNSILKGKFYLRICIVNHRTTYEHVESLPGIVIEAARGLDF